MTQNKIAILGIGYVGLPLAIEFGKKFKTLAYDVDQSRISELSQHYDSNNEYSSKEILNSKYLTFTENDKSMNEYNVFIITVPTPVDLHHKPNLTALVSATRIVASKLKRNDLVIYESTVYPGATEEECLPILEEISGLKLNIDFGMGYSPERVNPGDKSKPITEIVKITSGSDTHWANVVDELYASIIEAGTYQAESIKVAEAAKIVENVQRDLNIALINQLAQLFSVLDIDTNNVINAASTKWNFNPFKPGLVGGHCIGVDPYYLCHKAESVGYIPDIILAGRRLNDSMGEFIANQIIKMLTQNHVAPHLANILILGITFKENCSDIRNTKVPDVITELKRYQCNVSVFDPLADKNEVSEKLDLQLLDEVEDDIYDLMLLAVPHKELMDDFIKLRDKMKTKSLIYDLKGILPQNEKIVRL